MEFASERLGGLQAFECLAYDHAVRRILIVMMLTSAGVLGAEVATLEPRFAEGNRLVRPEGYHEWVFVGSSLGMSYDAGKPAYAQPPEFHNVYIKPESYRAFRSTGKFPDGTVFILELISAASKSSINKGGQFEDRVLGVEAAVKDGKRFPEAWAYFSFLGPQGNPLALAKPFPKTACWSCHNEHGALDNVFVQFYPVLREARPKANTP